MPLIRKTETSSPGSNLQLWKIEEPVGFFYEMIGKFSPHAEIEISEIHHEKRRLEWLSSRWLLMNILQEYGMNINQLEKDKYGKPYLKNCPLHLSISHAFPYVAAIVDENGPTGIDLEVPKEKIIRIAPKFMHPEELADAKGEVMKLTLYWCAKETLYKIYGRKRIQFNEQLIIDPFQIDGEVDINGRIIVDNITSTYQLHGHIHNGLVMVHKK